MNVGTGTLIAREVLPAWSKARAFFQGNGTTGVGHIEKENAKQFSLKQNFPNPYFEKTVIPFTLQKSADVTLDLYDLMGRKVKSFSQPGLSAGEQKIELDLKALNLPSANYAYQIEVRNADGIFRDCKMMTAEK